MSKGRKLASELSTIGLFDLVLGAATAITGSPLFHLLFFSSLLVTPIALIGSLLRYNKSQKSEKSATSVGPPYDGADPIPAADPPAMQGSTAGSFASGQTESASANHKEIASSPPVAPFAVQPSLAAAPSPTVGGKARSEGSTPSKRDPSRTRLIIAGSLALALLLASSVEAAREWGVGQGKASGDAAGYERGRDEGFGAGKADGYGVGYSAGESAGHVSSSKEGAYKACVFLAPSTGWSLENCSHIYEFMGNP